MALQDSLRSFGQGLTAIGPKVFHYYRPDTRTESFIYWAEGGEADSFEADDIKAEQIVEITVEYFTPVEYDTVIDAIQEFLKSSGYAWSLDDVLFEDDSGYISYSWRVEMVSTWQESR